MLESSTAAGTAVGVPTIAASVATALDGVAVGAAGLGISARALGSFGDDLGKFDYYRKLACEGTSGSNNPLVDDWGNGGRDSPYNNAMYHYRDRNHGAEVGAKDFDDYLRKASAFRDTVLSKRGIRTAKISGVSDNVYRNYYNGKYIDLQHILGYDSLGLEKIIGYKIISFGIQ